MGEQNLHYYSTGEKILIAVDCIIFGFDGERLKLLLFKRKIAPFEGQWSLIGSFVQSDEATEAAAQRVLFDFTGIENVYMDELKVYSDVLRDPGGRCISVGQYALIRVTDYHKALSEKLGTAWFDIDAIPNLVLDHSQMVKDALNRLKQKAQYYPIGFELLPKKFTLPMLQKLYEQIFDRQLDTRNFRKKLLSLDLVRQLDEKDRSTSKKGSFLYQFDHKKYGKLSKEGFQFSLLKF